ncbi:multifunctional CCA addition/repair protein [Vibrio coralliirubri]|uniref:multifunctional CCA addition/repair protein n=1 Tax=Vibrio coralliirubri TaxID=1516159 RepID=UPI00228418A7|nr:multifunctional CCA addition/repair protein [Vibrio coralliirubri]MCY9861486.1 multifunctional CCA addition/repair protein [Vibrio coralliirubri]
MTKIFLVGGAVRDILLNRTPKDHDYVVVGSTPEEMLANGFKCVGKDFPVFLHPDSGDEYALARTERKSGVGYTEFTFDTSKTITIEEDLQRRDLTINSIAQDLDTGDFIDPYNGINDLENRIIRHVSGAFGEDPLRVLRTARFLARYQHLGFSVAEETIELLKEMASSGELMHLTAERVWGEIQSALKTETPTAFFELLHEVGALDFILPELDCLWGVPQVEKHHPEVDTGVHIMMALNTAKHLTTDTVTLFGVLLHDLGKGITPEDVLPQHINHEETGVPLVKDVSERLKVSTAHREFAMIFCEQHLRIHRCMEMNKKSLLNLLIRLDARRKPDRLVQFCLAAEADAKGRLGLEDKPYPQKQFLIEVAATLDGIDMKQFDFATPRGKQDAHKAKLDAVQSVIKKYQE